MNLRFQCMLLHWHSFATTRGTSTTRRKRSGCCWPRRAARSAWSSCARCRARRPWTGSRAGWRPGTCSSCARRPRIPPARSTTCSWATPSPPPRTGSTRCALTSTHTPPDGTRYSHLRVQSTLYLWCARDWTTMPPHYMDSGALPDLLCSSRYGGHRFCSIPWHLDSIRYFIRSSCLRLWASQC